MRLEALVMSEAVTSSFGWLFTDLNSACGGCVKAAKRFVRLDITELHEPGIVSPAVAATLDWLVACFN